MTGSSNELGFLGLFLFADFAGRSFGDCQVVSFVHQVLVFGQVWTEWQPRHWWALGLSKGMREKMGNCIVASLKTGMSDFHLIFWHMFCCLFLSRPLAFCFFGFLSAPAHEKKRPKRNAVRSTKIPFLRQDRKEKKHQLLGVSAAMFLGSFL